MNRIVLIGNGFDLAHGLKTGYKDFIDDYWKNTFQEINQTEINRGNIFDNDELQIVAVDRVFESKLIRTFSDFLPLANKYKSQIQVKNKLFYDLSLKNALINWVNIERVYYQQLKTLFKTAYTPEILNSELERIEALLVQYLNKVQSSKDLIELNKKARVIGSQIYSKFKSEDISREGQNRILTALYEKFKRLNAFSSDTSRTARMFDLTENEKLVLDDFEEYDTIQDFENIVYEITHFEFLERAPENILLLNFNYTNTELLYEDPEKYVKFQDVDLIPNTEINHIHGSLDDKKNNPIIFGYGDEKDKDYLEIEESQKDSFLENIKSIAYLNTDNYRNLLDFIDLDNYQVMIMGHSCGVSDRTLLNTLFEHDNCVSIKPYYHKRGDDTDNYSELIKNISRNFTDKAKLRDRVVNKKYCEPLGLDSMV